MSPSTSIASSMVNTNYFIQAFGSTAELPTIWLLFTGADNSNGHFQLLESSADFLGNFKVFQKTTACTATLALSDYCESAAIKQGENDSVVQNKVSDPSSDVESEVFKDGMQIEVSDAKSEMENNEDSTIFDDTLFDVQKFHK